MSVAERARLTRQPLCGGVKARTGAICAQFGPDNSQDLGMENQRKMPDVVQDHDSGECLAMEHRIDRRGHDRIVIAEDSNLSRTPLAVRIGRAERDQRAHRAGWRICRVSTRNRTAEAVAY